jgi:aminoglycoside/choline kinase family phosphotransferase
MNTWLWGFLKNIDKRHTRTLKIYARIIRRDKKAGQPMEIEV